MATNFRISPPPIATKDSSVWAVWYTQVKDIINRIGESFQWVLLDFTGSNLTDIETRNHNDLQNIQGGGVGDHYHITLADKTKLDSVTTGAEPNQNAFGSVAVSGQTTVASDTTTDTLTLVAGTNITITTNATTDSITIGNSVSSMPTGGGTDRIFYENGQTVNTDYTITTNNSAMSAGPITIATGVTVTVPTGSIWVVV